MPSTEYNQYIEAIEVIEAREMINLIKASSYSTMKKEDQTTLWDELQSKINFDQKRIESDDLFSQMLGM